MSNVVVIKEVFVQSALKVWETFAPNRPESFCMTVIAGFNREKVFLRSKMGAVWFFLCGFFKKFYGDIGNNVCAGISMAVIFCHFYCIPFVKIDGIQKCSGSGIACANLIRSSGSSWILKGEPLFPDVRQPEECYSGYSSGLVLIDLSLARLTKLSGSVHVLIDRRSILLFVLRLIPEFNLLFFGFGGMVKKCWRVPSWVSWVIFWSNHKILLFLASHSMSSTVPMKGIYKKVLPKRLTSQECSSRARICSRMGEWKKLVRDVNMNRQITVLGSILWSIP